MSPWPPGASEPSSRSNSSSGYSDSDVSDASPSSAETGAPGPDSGQIVSGFVMGRWQPGQVKAWQTLWPLTRDSDGGGSNGGPSLHDEKSYRWDRSKYGHSLRTVRGTISRLLALTSHGLCPGIQWNSYRSHS